MKNLKAFFSLLMVAAVVPVFAQVQIDKPIQLTGGSGERVITNLEAPINPSDAANKAYVDAAVAALGGSNPSMMTDESSTTMTFQDGLRYCRDLTDGGYTDWYMPGYEDFEHLLSTDGISIPNETSASYFWLRHDGNPSGSQYTYHMQTARLSSGGYYSSSSTAGTQYVRCVR